MSDVVMSIYVMVVMGMGVAVMFHSARRHRRIVSSLIWWTFIGTFLSTVGGLLMVGTFTPNMANYSHTASDLFNAFSWGGINLPEYNDMMGQINNLGIAINAMGLGVLIMGVLSGFFPRSFFPH